MRVLKWVIFNGAFLFLIYAGLFNDIKGAENVVTLFAWIAIIASFFTLHDPIADAVRKKGRPVPAWLDITLDILIVAAFAWSGALITGAFLFIRMILIEAVINKEPC